MLKSGHRLDDNEHGHRDDDEVHQRVDEVSVQEARLVEREGEGAEVGLAPDGGDQRRDQVLHDGRHRGRERRSEHDGDGQIDQVSLEREFLEFLPHGLNSDSPDRPGSLHPCR